MSASASRQKMALTADPAVCTILCPSLLLVRRSNELLSLYREAFAAWLPPLGVPLSYAVAISYVLVDTYDKGQRAYSSAEKELGSRASLHPEVNTGR